MGKRGILISAEALGGEVKITVDDVTLNSSVSTAWNVADHVTKKAFPASTLSSMNFDEKELADFAFLLLSRLSAFADRQEL